MNSNNSAHFPAIVLGSDHAGFALKCGLAAWLAEQTDIITDLGCDSDSRCDYPDFAHMVARYVVGHPGSVGILVCGSGIGMSMAANRIAGARCALCTDATMARLARAHNDANILALGARLTGEETVRDILKAFLSTPFEGGRHQGRVDKIDPA